MIRDKNRPVTKTGKPGGQIGNANALKYDSQKVNDIARKLEEWIKKPESIFFGEFILLETDIRDEEALSDIAKDVKSFSDVLSKCREIQKYRLIHKGMKPGVNSSIPKMLLASWHNVREIKEENKEENQAHISISFV